MSNEVIETITVQGEGLTLSLMVWRRFRQPMPGLVEQILALNPNVASATSFLPVGAEILLPVPTQRGGNTIDVVRLWS